MSNQTIKMKQITILNQKQSQLALLSVFFLLSIFIFFYSIETPNTFNTQPSKIYIIDSIENQFCLHTKSISNGTLLNNSLEEFDQKMELYCNILSTTCEIESYIFNSPPGDNLSLLSYNDVEMNYSISSEFSEISNSMRCS